MHRTLVFQEILFPVPVCFSFYIMPIPSMFPSLSILETYLPWDITSWIELAEWHHIREVVATLRFGRVKTLQKVPWEGKVSKARFASVSKLKIF